MNIEEFRVVDFQPRIGSGFVYILYCDSGGRPLPFYVGETQAIWRRLDDYYWAQFDASTDFRVGEAVRYLHAKGLRVMARYKPSEDRRNGERSIIGEFRAQGIELLNDLRGYDYRTAKEDEERSKIQRFIDRLISKVATGIYSPSS
jgi:hypothetical protein